MRTVLIWLAVYLIPGFLVLTLSPFPVQTFILFAAYVLISCVSGYRSLSKELNRVEVKGRSGYIYAFFDLGNVIPAIKIGRGTTPDDRLNSHRTAAPLGIIVLCNFRVPDSVYAEGYLHRKYAPLRLSRRNEWFFASPFLIVSILLLRLFRR